MCGGIDQSTFDVWMNRIPQFAEDVKKAENESELGAVAVIRQAMQGGAVLSRHTVTQTLPDGRSTTTVEETLSKPEWTAAAWLLERRLPREYGKVERIELSIRERARELAEELGPAGRGGHGRGGGWRSSAWACSALPAARRAAS
jgi:hypothetical protein